MRIVRVHDAGGLLLRWFAHPVPLAPRDPVRIRLFSRYDLRGAIFGATCPASDYLLINVFFD
jgi:hypothetical protein